MNNANPNALSLNSVVDMLLDVVCVVDAQGRFVFVSAACEAMWGYTPQQLVGQHMLNLVAPEDRDRTLQAAHRIMAGDTHLHFENRYLHQDGRRVDVMWSARWSPAEQLRIAVGRDITARKRAESMQAATYALSEAAHEATDLGALLQQIPRILASLLPSRRFAVALVDAPTGHLRFHHRQGGANPEHAPPTAADVAFGQHVMAAGRPVLLNPQPADSSADSSATSSAAPNAPLVSAPWNAERSCWLGAPLRSQKGTVGAVTLERAADEPPYTQQDLELLHYVSTQMAAAIERQQLTDKLQHMAQFDALTDLPNRAYLEDRMAQAIERVKREGRSLSLLYLDLDHFKQVNDTHGHALGDRLLQAFARRLTGCVRAADTVARMSGDEFVVLLESEQLGDADRVVALKIAAEFERPFELDGHVLPLRPSMGVARYPEHGTDVAQLFRHADDAMYVDKHSRR